MSNRGKPGNQDLFFDDVKARYVKVQGIKRGTGWGYSLWEMKVYGGTPHVDGLSDVRLLKLRLSGAGWTHHQRKSLLAGNTPGGFHCPQPTPESKT